eukprot:5364613-Amphidinium_carterae.1
MDTIQRVPAQHELEVGISGKWATILTVLKHNWQKCMMDIYAIRRKQHTNESYEFMLTTAAANSPNRQRNRSTTADADRRGYAPSMMQVVEVDGFLFCVWG